MIKILENNPALGTNLKLNLNLTDNANHISIILYLLYVSKSYWHS